MADQLAIYGGEPISKPLPKWEWPPPDYCPGPAIANFLNEGGSLTPRGREGVIGECEDVICEKFNQARALLLPSGTTALYAAFFAIGLEPGDELICPTVTFHATASPALHLGAKVVLVDVLPDTGCIDVNAAAAAITPRTKALVTNAQWGHPIDQDGMRKLCDRHHLAWIEDISHAHCAELNGKQVGTWGDLACASLGTGKVLTGGMAGVLMGKRDDLIDRAILFTHYLFRSKDDIRTPGFEGLARTGYGLKMEIHPLAAVVILDQLNNHLDNWINDRNVTLKTLSEGLRGLEGLRPPVIGGEVTSMGGWYGFKPWIDVDKLEINRDDLAKALKAEGVPVKAPGSPPLHQLPLFDPDQLPVGPWSKARFNPDAFPNAKLYTSGLLSIPTFTGKRDQEYVDLTIRGFRKVWNFLVVKNH